MRLILTIFLLAAVSRAQDLIRATDYGYLFFKVERGNATPPPQVLTLDTDEHRPLGIVSVQGAWLHVLAGSDSNPQTLTFSVDPAGLNPAIYEGSVLFTLGDTFGTVNIRLTVLDRARFITIPTTLEFTPQAPTSQTLYVTAANQPVGFGATVNADAKWLTVTPALGNTPANLTVSVNPAGLTGGTYTGTITLISAGALSVTVPVSLVVAGGAPQFTMANVWNLASNQPGPIAPGEALRITGIQQGATGFDATPTSDGVAATMLLDTRLLFDGVPVPLLSVATGQVRAVAPFEIDGKTSVQAQLEYKGLKSDPVTLTVAGAQPGIFTTDLTGKGQAVASHYNPPQPSQNTPINRARKDGILLFFGTGAGQLMPPGKTGSLRGGSGVLRLPVQVTIGGKNADIVYAGAAPGLTEGMSQFNVRIPMDAPSGPAVPLIVIINGVSSQPGVTVGVE